MSIPFIDLKTQYRRLEEDIRSNIDKVLAHGKFIMGPEVAELEQNLAEFVGTEFAVACSNGTDALLMALMTYGVGPGDAVFTTPFSFIATAEPITLLGATPVFADIDPRTFNIDPTALEREVRRVKAAGELRLRGIISVDLFGLPADYDPIMNLAEAEGLFVIEDAAQGFGGMYKERAAGNLGHVATTSFYPAKPLGCYGDGGAVFTNDPQFADELRSIRVHGKGTNKYDNVRIGLNARLDTLQAAILLAKLRVFPDELQARQRLADRYTAGLADWVEAPHTPPGLSSAWAQYSVLSKHRDAIQAALKDAGTPTAVYYPTPLHLQPAFADLGYKVGDFPESERVAQRIFSLPMHPYLSDAQVDVIVATIAQAARTCGDSRKPGTKISIF